MFRTAGLAFFSVLAALILWFSQAFALLEARLLDAQFTALRAISPRPLQVPDVVVVGIDEATTRELPEPLSLWHGHFGSFVQAASAGGARVIGLDVVLPERSFDAVLPGADRALLGPLVLARRGVPVVLAITVDPAGRPRKLHPPFASAVGADGLGYVLLPRDGDGVVRRFDERLAASGESLPTLAGQMARRIGRPVSAGWIDLTLGPTFDYLPLHQVLAWSRAGDEAALRQAFAGRAVLLGSVLALEDRHASPASLAGWDAQSESLPGVLLHAQVLRNLLDRGPVQPAPALLVGALMVLGAMAWRLPLGNLAATGFLLGLAVAGLVVSTLVLRAGWQLPLVGAWLLAFIALLTRQLLLTGRQLRERAQLRSVFGGYVSPGVMRQILSGRIQPTLGGERRFCCVMFSDIRGYTARSEHASPEQTIAFLNRYFDRVVPVIHAHGGTVVSFMGDGIMAVFGAPNPLPNPCESAYTASIAMLAQLRTANIEFASRGEEPIRIGIGLHAGEGVSGHVGSSARHEYSVIGDVTNVASRLEGLTKEVGYQLVCSDAVARDLPDRADLVPLGQHALKGRAAVEIYGAQRVEG